MALLKRGVSKRMSEVRELILGQAMEYAGAIGTMLFDQMANNNKKTEEVFGRALNQTEWEVMRIDDKVNKMEIRLQEAEETIGMLVANIWGKVHTIDMLEQMINRIEDRFNAVLALGVRGYITSGYIVI